MTNLTEIAQWEDGIYQIETSDPVLGGPDGISNKQAKLLANRTSYLKQQTEAGAQGLADHVAATDPHPRYAQKDSPALTGKPVAPTAAQTSNDTQLATTAFVKAALAALVASSPEALDTLNELAAALGNDANFAATMTMALAGKQPKDATLTNLSGKDIAGLLQYLGLGGMSSGMFPIGMPFHWPNEKMPNELLPEWAGMSFLKWNGATFDPLAFPKLAQVIPGLTLVDARGEFIRNWDDSRGLDAGRNLLSYQESAAPNITGAIPASAYSIFPQSLVGAIQAGVGWVGNDADKHNTSMTSGMNFDASRCSGVYKNGVREVRPGNLAFNYLVRAA